MVSVPTGPTCQPHPGPPTLALLLTLGSSTHHLDAKTRPSKPCKRVMGSPMWGHINDIMALSGATKIGVMAQTHDHLGPDSVLSWTWSAATSSVPLTLSSVCETPSPAGSSCIHSTLACSPGVWLHLHCSNELTSSWIPCKQGKMRWWAGRARRGGKGVCHTPHTTCPPPRLSGCMHSSCPPGSEPPAHTPGTQSQGVSRGPMGTRHTCEPSSALCPSKQLRRKPPAPKPGPGEKWIWKQTPMQQIIHTVKGGKNGFMNLNTQVRDSNIQAFHSED